MKKIVALIMLMVIGVNSFSQVLDVPSRWDIPGCGKWCVPVAAHGIIVYYGNSDHLCDVLEVYRQFNGSYGTINCCQNPLNCCAYGSTIDIPRILDNWGIPSTFLERVLTLQEIYHNLSLSRPFIIRIGPSGHVLTGYGCMYGHIFINDGGNGQILMGYSELVTNGPYNDGRPWNRTVRLDVSAQTCPDMQNITGAFNGQTMVYKAYTSIIASCIIDNSSNISFRSGGSVSLNNGFEVRQGSSLTILTGSTLSCP